MRLIIDVMTAGGRAYIDWGTDRRLAGNMRGLSLDPGRYYFFNIIIIKIENAAVPTAVRYSCMMNTKPPDRDVDAISKSLLTLSVDQALKECPERHALALRHLVDN